VDCRIFSKVLGLVSAQWKAEALFADVVKLGIKPCTSYSCASVMREMGRISRDVWDKGSVSSTPADANYHRSKQAEEIMLKQGRIRRIGDGVIMMGTGRVVTTREQKTQWSTIGSLVGRETVSVCGYDKWQFLGPDVRCVGPGVAQWLFLRDISILATCTPLKAVVKSVFNIPSWNLIKRVTISGEEWGVFSKRSRRQSLGSMNRWDSIALGATVDDVIARNTLRKLGMSFDVFTYVAGKICVYDITPEEARERFDPKYFEG